MPALNFISIIVSVFLIFAIRYFIKNNIANSQQRKTTAAASLLLVYYSPLFLQGLFLIWIVVTHFFFIVRSLFCVLLVVLPGSVQENVIGNNLNSLAILFTGSLLLGFNGLLAKISRESTRISSKALQVILYLFYSAAMFYIVYKNRTVCVSFGINFSDIFLFTNPYVIMITLLATVALIITMFSENMSKIVWLRYLQLPVKVSLLYSAICFLIALVFFIVFVFFRILF
jgi:hypothetical protein